MVVAVPHPTDEELVRRVRGGDESAFAEICSRHGERLTRQVEARLSGGVLRKVGASDVVQEAYVVALQRIPYRLAHGVAISDLDGRGRGWL